VARDIYKINVTVLQPIDNRIKVLIFANIFVKSSLKSGPSVVFRYEDSYIIKKKVIARVMQLSFLLIVIQCHNEANIRYCYTNFIIKDVSRKYNPGNNFITEAMARCFHNVMLELELEIVSF
jgi:hypothetical protein